jgi:hypothetical protein
VAKSIGVPISVFSSWPELSQRSYRAVNSIKSVGARSRFGNDIDQNLADADAAREAALAGFGDGSQATKV